MSSDSEKRNIPFLDVTLVENSIRLQTWYSNDNH